MPALVSRDERRYNLMAALGVRNLVAPRKIRDAEARASPSGPFGLPPMPQSIGGLVESPS